LCYRKRKGNESQLEWTVGNWMKYNDLLGVVCDENFTNSLLETYHQHRVISSQWQINVLTFRILKAPHFTYEHTTWGWRQSKRDLFQNAVLRLFTGWLYVGRLHYAANTWQRCCHESRSFLQLYKRQAGCNIAWMPGRFGELDLKQGIHSFILYPNVNSTVSFYYV
jgi:hypothetical protein